MTVKITSGLHFIGAHGYIKLYKAKYGSRIKSGWLTLFYTQRHNIMILFLKNTLHTSSDVNEKNNNNNLL